MHTGVKNIVSLCFLLCYMTLYFLVMVSFPDDLQIDALLFVSINLLITIFFIVFLKFDAGWPLLVIIYSIYFMAYIFKGISVYTVGLNTKFSLMSIRSFVDVGSYVGTLVIVTIGHVLLVFTALCLKPFISIRGRNIIGTINLMATYPNIILVGCTIWIIISSIIMYVFGVALMGSDPTGLPYKMSGIMFYSRTILIPIILIFFVEQAILRGEQSLFKKTIFVFLLLVASEIVIRASKAPLFLFILQMLILFMVVKANVDRVAFKVNKAYISILIIAAIGLTPFIDTYRSIVVNRTGTPFEYFTEASHQIETSNKNYIVWSLEKFFGRVLGFRQLAGLVADRTANSKLSDVIESGSISKYYTWQHLGYRMTGHLSSPSFIGACLIVGGEFGWFMVFVGYVIMMVFIWNATLLLFPNIGVSAVCLVGVEITNTIMSGNIDASLFRIFIIFCLSATMEVIILLTNHNKLRVITS